MVWGSAALKFVGQLCQAHRNQDSELSPSGLPGSLMRSPRRDGSCHRSYFESLFENCTKNGLLANGGGSCEGPKPGAEGQGCEELWGSDSEQGCEVLSCRGCGVTGTEGMGL